MAKFMVAYFGGMVADNPEARDASMGEWMAWFESLGDAVVQMGSPFGASGAVASDGSVSDSRAGLTGYSIVEADGVNEAAQLVSKCPIFSDGGSMEVYEALMM